MKIFTKSLFITAVAALFTAKNDQLYAQNKFNMGISTPFYFGTARYGDLLQYANERHNYTGKDALSFGPAVGLGIFGELEFGSEWIFDVYWQKYANTTNFGKSGIDGGAKAQYKMKHSIIGVGASRKAFQVMGQQLWMFTAIGGGGRSFFYRNEGGKFSKERRTSNKLFISATEAPIYFNIGLAPKFTVLDKFYISPKIGYEIELMRGDGKDFNAGLNELVQASYNAVNNNTTKSYAELSEKSLNRLFIELRAGIRLGK